MFFKFVQQLAHLTIQFIGADLLLKHGEVLRQHKQSNKIMKNTLYCAAYREECVGF